MAAVAQLSPYNAWRRQRRLINLDQIPHILPDMERPVNPDVVHPHSK